MSHTLQRNHLEQQRTHRPIVVRCEYNYSYFIHETMQHCYNVEQCKVLIAENKVVIDKLIAKLRHTEEELQTSNKRMNIMLSFYA